MLKPRLARQQNGKKSNKKPRKHSFSGQHKGTYQGGAKQRSTLVALSSYS